MELDVATPPIAVGEFGRAFPRHCTGQQPGCHGRIDNHAKSVRPTIRQNLLFDFAADQRIRRLQRSDRSDRLRPAHFLDVEVGYADPSDLSFLLQLSHRAPAFFQVITWPMDLVKVDNIDDQSAPAILTFATNRIRRQIAVNVSLLVPAQTTFGENVRPRSRPSL